MAGLITIHISGIGAPETERAALIIKKCLEEGIFNIRNGKAVLNFDSDGSLSTIEFNVTKWRRGKESIDTMALYEAAHIDASTISEGTPP